MRKLSKFILKLTPLLVGLVWVAHDWQQKQRRRFSVQRVLIVLLLLALIVVGSSAWVVRSHLNDTFTGRSANCAVVFGAAVWKDDVPSHALNDRTQAAIALYKNGQVPCLIFSGGASTFGAHEVDVMGKLAQSAGVPAAALRYDYHGDSTLATLMNLPPAPGYVLVSNDFHLARINLAAQRLGLTNFYLHAAPYRQGIYAKHRAYFWREVGGVLVVWFGL
jgi:vancomycin permeability regulator SanA